MTFASQVRLFDHFFCFFRDAKICFILDPEQSFSASDEIVLFYGRVQTWELFFFLSSRGNPNMKPKAKPIDWLKKEKTKKQLSFLLPELELVTFQYA